MAMLKSLKKEEQLVPDSIVDGFFESNSDNLSEFEGILGVKNGENQGESVMSSTYDEISWDHLIEWDEFSIDEGNQDRDVCDRDKSAHREGNMVNIKKEISGIWDDDEDQAHGEKKKSLNLSLNYQDVMDAWSNRAPCWTHDFAQSTSDNGYMGEVPVMEEARTKREASVLKYKRKRENRLFSRKIRYHVRKLNADKRPRLKGRFVKRES